MSDPTPTTPAPADQSNAPLPLALRPKHAARALGVSERTLWAITADRSSGIPHCRFGKCVVYPVNLLRDWLAKRAQQGGATDD